MNSQLLRRAVQAGAISAQEAERCHTLASELGALSKETLIAIARGVLSREAAEALMRVEADRPAPSMGSLRSETRPTLLVTPQVAGEAVRRERERLEQEGRIGRASGVVSFLDTVGSYYLQEPLGRGGMGCVVQAYQRDLDRTVALKFIDPEGGLTQPILDQFALEMRLQARLQHRAIVAVLAADLGALCPYIVLERIEGESLGRKLRGRKLSLRQGVELIATLADALAHAHERGVAHMDVKPGNVLVDEAGQPHLFDFGLAIDIRSGPQVPSQWGTPNTMAPEQLLAQPADGRADVYALGCVLYELIAGKRPFDFADDADHDRISEVVILEGPPPLSSDDPDGDEELLALVALAMTRHQDDRPTARELEVALRAWLAGERPRPAPSGPPPAAWWALAGAAVGGPLGAALAALWGS